MTLRFNSDVPDDAPATAAAAQPVLALATTLVDELVHPHLDVESVDGVADGEVSEIHIFDARLF